VGFGVWRFWHGGSLVGWEMITNECIMARHGRSLRYQRSSFSHTHAALRLLGLAIRKLFYLLDVGDGGEERKNGEMGWVGRKGVL